MHDWKFPALLVAAMLLALLFGYFQQKSYASTVSRMARENSGQPTRYLVSGQGRGRTRGVIVVLIVDAVQEAVIEARRMAGVSIFARMKGAPDLLGPIDSIEERSAGKKDKQAAAMALTQYRAAVAREEGRRAAASEATGQAQGNKTSSTATSSRTSRYTRKES